MKNLNKWFRWFFADKEGNIVIAQFPNLPLFVAMVGLATQHLSQGHSSNVGRLVAYAGLLVWAWLEVYKGDSYFRRLLGLVVLGSTLATVFA